MTIIIIIIIIATVVEHKAQETKKTKEYNVMIDINLKFLIACMNNFSRH